MSLRATYHRHLSCRRLMVIALIMSFTNITLRIPLCMRPLIRDEVFLDCGIREYLEAPSFSII